MSKTAPAPRRVVDVPVEERRPWLFARRCRSCARSPRRRPDAPVHEREVLVRRDQRVHEVLAAAAGKRPSAGWSRPRAARARRGARCCSSTKKWFCLGARTKATSVTARHLRMWVMAADLADFVDGTPGASSRQEMRGRARRGRAPRPLPVGRRAGRRPTRARCGLRTRLRLGDACRGWSARGHRRRLSRGRDRGRRATICRRTSGAMRADVRARCRSRTARFDLVVCFEVIEHVDEQERGARRAAPRARAQAALLVISSPEPRALRPRQPASRARADPRGAEAALTRRWRERAATAAVDFDGLGGPQRDGHGRQRGAGQARSSTSCAAGRWRAPRTRVALAGEELPPRRRACVMLSLADRGPRVGRALRRAAADPAVSRPTR